LPATRKASLLSIVERTQLVKSVIYGMLMHTVTIYSWSASLIKVREMHQKCYLEWTSKFGRPHQKMQIPLTNVRSLGGSNILHVPR
jgi:hypothetical protein